MSGCLIQENLINQEISQVQNILLEKHCETCKVIKNHILIVTTQTSDITLPGISNQLQSDLKIKNDVISFDLGLGCSGFIYSLFIALKLMQGEQSIKRSLLVFCDTYSHYVDEHDRTMLPLFSDCVSAVLVQTYNSSNKLYFVGSGSYNFIKIED